MKLKPYGDQGVLLASLSDRQRAVLIKELESGLPEGCEEFVVGYESILLVGQGILVETIAALGDVATSKPAPILKIDVIYNGADLRSVAKACGLTVERVIDLHSAPTYTVRMMGFSPGFPYLEGLDSRLHLPRRNSPRNQIAPGTVAIGGSHAGIYSVASPGGWHLLGQTELPLFNVDAAKQSNPNPKDVFALTLGDRVRFQPKSVQ